jgi:enamine deaminase RidA (YjgF/YER057c/UK114 family)
MSIRAKLKELGLELPVAALPLAAYVPAVKTGKLVFTAGQLPMANGAIAKTGKVGAEVSPEEAKELAQLCALNALAALNLVADVDDVARIVRVVGYVNGAPAVVNGASELLIALWGDENGKHARSAIGVAELPLNSPVEVELTFELK